MLSDKAPGRGRWLYRSCRAVGLISGLVLLAFLLLILVLAISPKPDLYRHYQQAGAYFTANGELLSLRLASDERYRLKVELADIAPALQQATLLYEDRRFYSHNGVDLRAIARVIWQSGIKSGRRQGASTLTMQLARLRFQLNSNTFAGKLQQIACAVYLEWHFSKDELLEAYFNYAPYGGNIEGAAAASLIYFGKEANRLTLPEALALAVMPQNPVQRNPHMPQGERALQQARMRLAQLWLQHKHKTDKIPDDIAWRLALPLQYLSRSDLPFESPHFINQLMQQGHTQGRFYTSLNLSLQQQVQQIVQAYLLRRQNSGLNNASVLLLKRSSMQVLAWLGSASFDNDHIFGQVDGVTALRSPGSALKPFVYALALQQGLIHPKSLLTDLPRRYGGFNPENFDYQFAGPISATQALVQSRNLPAVQLQSQLQQPDFYQWLTQAGVMLPQPAGYYGLALVLGGMELSMQQLAQLYASLGNAGQWQPIQWQAQPSAQPATQILNPEAAFLTLDMLRQHSKPGAELISQLTTGPAVAWKTGTSYAFRDAWTVGLSDDYVLAVWLGNFDGSSNANLVGRTAAAPLFFDILQALPTSAEASQLFNASASLNLRKVELCRRSGDLPNKYCTDTEPGWFIPGVSPIKVSDVHRAVPVYSKNGIRACYHQPPLTELKIFEFWPSDIQASFERAGIILKQPPAYQTGCDTQNIAQGSAPKILSPQPQLTYQLGAGPDQQLALQASFDGAVTQAHWFADHQYLGSVKPGETLYWQAEAGRFQLKVVDDLGGTDNIVVNIQTLSQASLPSPLPVLAATQ